jgi:flagellar biosynthesis/type III secretory pathway M-ring protein FliF/YscJ
VPVEVDVKPGATTVHYVQPKDAPQSTIEQDLEARMKEKMQQAAADAAQERWKDAVKLLRQLAVERPEMIKLNRTELMDTVMEIGGDYKQAWLDMEAIEEQRYVAQPDLPQPPQPPKKKVVERTEQTEQKEQQQQQQQQPTAAGSAQTNPVPIRDWLVHVNPVLAVYAEALGEYGYENTHLLRDATDEDIAEALADIKMKKPHQRTAKKAIVSLRDEL